LDRPIKGLLGKEAELQAELEATNWQVEILSNALAESRREVASLKANAALDRKAENARELGLDYEPYKGISEHMTQATKGRVRIDPVTGDVGIGTPPAQPAPVQATMKLESSGPRYGPPLKQKLSVRHVSLIDEGKTAAQQEPVWNNLPSNKDVEDAMRMKRLNQLATPPAAQPVAGKNQSPYPEYDRGFSAGWDWCFAATQPAVPDAIGPNEDELPAYAAGWNDCRAEMLRGMKL
jgi:hypothetical protein